jgi:two-component system cell cycle response regulator DivK
MTVGPAIPCDRPFLLDARQPLALAIDDNYDNLLVLEYALELFGFRFIGENDALEGLTAIQTHQPDLVLMDILLPGVDGMALIELLRRDIHLAPIPVIAVTGLAGDEERDRILECGFTDYLCKPFMLDDLEILIHRHVHLPAHLEGRD